MKIAIHLGVHCTDEGALLRCLLKNREALAAQGIVLPEPERYPILLREAGKAVQDPPTEAEPILDLLVTEDKVERVVFSFESLMAFPRWSLGRGMFYPGGTERTLGLARLFPGCEISFYLALRSPATFLPLLFQRQKGKTYEEFMLGSDPVLLRWSDLLTRIRAETPHASVTVWCDEDTPIIWPEVLAQVSGHDPDTVLDGRIDRLASVMQPAGHQRMLDYLAKNPPLSDAHRRKIIAAFLDKFAAAEALDLEFELPGWTDETVEALNAAYVADLGRIMDMDGVQFLTP